MMRSMTSQSPMLPCNRIAAAAAMPWCCGPHVASCCPPCHVALPTMSHGTTHHVASESCCPLCCITLPTVTSCCLPCRVALPTMSHHAAHCVVSCCWPCHIALP